MNGPSNVDFGGLVSVILPPDGRFVYDLPMKSISSSIVVLSGAVLLLGGSFVSQDQTQSVLQYLGGGIGLLGLVAWYRTIQQPGE